MEPQVASSASRAVLGLKSTPRQPTNPTPTPPKRMWSRPFHLWVTLCRESSRTFRGGNAKVSRDTSCFQYSKSKRSCSLFTLQSRVFSTNGTDQGDRLSKFDVDLRFGGNLLAFQVQQPPPRRPFIRYFQSCPVCCRLNTMAFCQSSIDPTDTLCSVRFPVQ